MTDGGRSLSARLLELYATAASAADELHRRRWTLAPFLALLVTLLLVGINRYVLLDFPNSGDEYNYLYEAWTLAAGRLWNVPQGPSYLLATNYVIQENSRVFSSFPFGWPLLLAMAMRAGIPAWLVNPILGAVTLGLIWALGARLYSGRAGVAAAILFGVSPFFLFNAASYFSHTFCGVLLLGAAFIASRDDRRPIWVPAAVGLLIGWAVVARYLTGVIGGVPIVLWLLRPGVPRLRTLALVALGGVPWVAALAAYNSTMTGSMFDLTTTPLTVSLWFRDGWLLRSADILSTHLLRHLLWTPAFLIVAYLVYLRRAAAEGRRAPLEWIPIITVVVLYFYVERGGNQYGPRFHYEASLFMVIFVAGNLLRTASLAGRPVVEAWLFGLAVVSILLQPVSFAIHASVERQVIVERMDPFRQVEAAGLSAALVLIADRVGTRRSIAAADLTRNGIEPTRPVLYALDQGDDRPCRWAAEVPGRRAYSYVWDHAASRGLLRPLTCAPAGSGATQPQRAGDTRGAGTPKRFIGGGMADGRGK
jgi:hypothetical protein